MRIGRLRKRLTLQTEGTPTSDGAGGFTQTWQAIDTVWGRVEPLSDREIVSADALVGRVTHRVTIRHRTDVDEGDRVLLGSRAFNIKGVKNPEERDVFLELTCEEGGPT